MYAIKQFYLKLFNAKTTMKDKTMMCDETKNECCNHADPRRGMGRRSSPLSCAGWTT